MYFQSRLTEVPQSSLSHSLALSAAVDLKYGYSPSLPTLPIVTLPSSRGPQGFFLSAATPEAHPLGYSLGSAYDYRSSQAGTPQVCTDTSFLAERVNSHSLSLYRELRYRTPRVR